MGNGGIGRQRIEHANIPLLFVLPQVLNDGFGESPLKTRQYGQVEVVGITAAVSHQADDSQRKLSMTLIRDRERGKPDQRTRVEQRQSEQPPIVAKAAPPARQPLPSREGCR